MIHETRYNRQDTAAKFHYLYCKSFGNDHICLCSLYLFLFHDRRQECLIEGNTEYEKVPIIWQIIELKRTDIFQIIIMLNVMYIQSSFN